MFYLERINNMIKFRLNGNLMTKKKLEVISNPS